MNQHLKERVLRKLESLSDERAYQILDYIEFLESKYADRQAPSNIFTKFADTVEDGLRAGKISTSAIAETMNLMNRAMGVLGGVAAAGKSVATDFVATAREAGKQVSDIARSAGGARPSDGGGPANQAAPETVAGAAETAAAATAQADGTVAPPEAETPDAPSAEPTRQVQGR